MNKLTDCEYSVPTEFSATHSYFPWSLSILFVICNAPAKKHEKNKQKTDKLLEKSNTINYFTSGITNSKNTKARNLINNTKLEYVIGER